MPRSSFSSPINTTNKPDGLFNDHHKAAYINFAKSNGFSYQHRVEFKSITETGSPFTKVTTASITGYMEGELAGLPFSSGYLLYKDRNRFIPQLIGDSLGFMRVSLMRYVPQIVIDNRLEYKVSGSSTLTKYYDSSQILKLEGDFNKYFTVYVPHDHELSALTILAPDIMAFLIDNNSFCDIEITSSQLYFYWSSSPFFDEEYAERFNMIERFLDELKDKLIRADVFADDNQREAHLSTTSISNPSKLRQAKFVTRGLPAAVYFALCIVYFARNSEIVNRAFSIFNISFSAEAHWLLRLLLLLAFVYVVWLIGKMYQVIKIEMAQDKKNQ